MRALVFDGALRFNWDHPVPEPDAGEALVQVRLAGICNTDLEITKGYMGFRGVLGHEFVGTVVACAEKHLVGRRVVGEINCPCGTCRRCLGGLGNHCRDRTVLGIAGRDGAFADYLTLPVGNLHEVPESLTDEEAVFVEPLAAALEILEQGPPRPSDKVVVIGDGKLGLLVAQVVALTGSRVVVVGRHPEKLRHAAGWGIETVQGQNAALPDEADVVVECTGRPEGMQVAKQVVRPRGRIVLKSTYAPGTPTVPVDEAKLVIDEISVSGSRCGPFAPALRLLGRHLVNVRPLITATYGLVEGGEALARAGDGTSLKVLLDVGSGV